MVIHIKIAIILYKGLIINYIINNASESRASTGYTLIVRPMYM